MARGRIARRLVAGLVMQVVVLASGAHAQTPDPLVELFTEVARLRQEGKHAEALPVAERAVAFAREHHGEEDVAVALSMNVLVSIYWAQGRYGETEPLLKRGLAINESAFGPEHPDVAIALDSLAQLYQVQDRTSEAEPLFEAQPRHPRGGAWVPALRRWQVAQ